MIEITAKVLIESIAIKYCFLSQEKEMYLANLTWAIHNLSEWRHLKTLNVSSNGFFENGHLETQKILDQLKH